MGMYTQVRGWLNVDSVGKEENLEKIKAKLIEAQSNFEDDLTLKSLDRKWVCHDTIVHSGGNGSCYIFFGTELKNYGNPAYEWIKYLINYFPNAEGRVDFQYEEDDISGESRYLLISGGKIVEDGYTKIWCEGYGNMYKDINA